MTDSTTKLLLFCKKNISMNRDLYVVNRLIEVKKKEILDDLINIS